MTLVEHQAPITLIDRLCARVYLGLHGEQALDADDVVGLACALFDHGHGGAAVRAAVEGAPGRLAPGELAASAARILDEAAFDPGFDLAPERLAVLRRALRIVARDLPAAGIEGEPTLVVLEDFGPPAAGVRLADGTLLTDDAELCASLGDDPARAVAAIAEHVQSRLAKRSWTVWPVCADHGVGLHGVERQGAAVWWCSGDGGHAVARVGALIRTDATG